MNLGEFHERVQKLIKRGAAFDAEIPYMVAGAAMWLERNYTFKYMERFVTFTLDPELAVPRAVTLPEPGVKAISFMRNLSPLNEYKYLIQVDPQDVISIETGLPDRFWIDGDQAFWFDKTPDQRYTIELSYDRLTTWPTALDASHWLLDFAWDVLSWQVMIMMAPALRMDGTLLAMYKGLRDEGLRTLTLAQEELNQSARNISMR